MNTEKVQTKKKFSWNILSCLFIYLWAGVFFASSLTIKDPASRAFPQIMCGLSILLSTIFLVTTLMGKQDNTGVEGEISFAGTGRASAMGGILILYILANYLTGFYISSLIYLPVGMLYLGQRNWKVIAGVSIGLPLIIYVFFDLLLGMMMPTGLLFQ